MALAVLRRCALCPELSDGPLCSKHQAEAGHPRGTTTQRGLGSAWARRSRAAVEAWVSEHGWVCPGDGMGQGEHEATDLTGDHDLPRAAGGTADDGVTVRCRSCNSRRGAKGAPLQISQESPPPQMTRAPISDLSQVQTSRPARRWWA